MADPYLDYLAGQQLALARQEDEIVALRNKLQAARETYEAFLESGSPVIAVPREDHVRANASRITSTGEQEPPAALCGCHKCVDARIKERDVPFHLNVPGPGFPGWRYGCEICGNKRCPHHSNHELACTASNEPGQPGSDYEKWSPATASLGAEPRLTGEPVPKPAAREAQPADEPDNPMPTFLRRAPA